MIRPVSPQDSAIRRGSSLRRRSLALLAAAIGSSAALNALPPGAWAQNEPPPVAAAGGGLNLSTVQTLLSRGDAAIAAGNLAEARRLYDDARTASQRLSAFYRDIVGAFRGLDARIPREMDDKGRQAVDLQAQSNLRLAALFRRQGQPEVAVPLLVDVLKLVTPASDQGRRAYQQLLEIGFVSTPYGPASSN
ncbi:MAG: hypothetical protein ACKOXO_02080 [Cyanobium sp.]